MLKVEKTNDVTVVKFDNVDRFNALITEPVKEQLKSLFNTPETKLVLNLEGIRFIDSSGFGVFLSIMKTAANNHGHF
jgi:anti-sigma B factor antagonist